jgi:ribonuclease D
MTVRTIGLIGAGHIGSQLARLAVQHGYDVVISNSRGPETLKDLVRELLGVDLSKQLQLSDWGAAELTDAQVAYAASDVLHLHALKAKLDGMLVREGRDGLAAACFRFLPDRARLDLAGWGEQDIFAHS